jgi:hypothetical protein
MIESMRRLPSRAAAASAPRVSRPAALFALATLLAASPVLAQPVPGALRGQVVSGDSVLSSAAVELLRDGMLIRQTMTDATGGFLFPGVAPGRYDVAVRLVGYTAGEQRNVDIVSGETRVIRIQLQPAPVQLDPLAVVSDVIRIDRRSTEFSTNFDEQRIRSLPLAHDPRRIVELTPGARADHVWGGATVQANNYQIDGLAANHPGVGGDLIQLSMTWIDRIEVRVLGPGPKHGNFQGGLINVVTKSGTDSRRAFFRSSNETHHLNSSNIEYTEIGSEIDRRRDLEAELSGPLVRGRLFYYLAGQHTLQDSRFINHLRDVDDRYSPVLEKRRDGRFFGKLTWRPSQWNLLEASAIRMDSRMDHAGNTGYETADATMDLRSASLLYNVHWQRSFASGSAIEAKIARLENDETRSPYAGEDVPGIQTFAQLPPYLGFQNAPIRLRHAPSSTTGTLMATLRRTFGSHEYALKVGAEHTLGTHIDQRLRNGGVTWRPPRRGSMDAADPETWRTSQSYPAVPVTFGGEVDLNAEVENSALFAQATLGFGPRLTLNPGVRYGRWAGRLTPAGGGEKFTALEADAFEPRIGGIFDVTGNSSFVLKAHWGRYHQNMIAQFFDRAQGGNVFTDEELWHYFGPITGPGMPIAPEDRSRLAQEGLLTRQAVIRLNETGPVGSYRQPYVDQWLVGFEKRIGAAVKVEGLYLNRRNRQMVALVDRNAATNYTRFEYVNVFGAVDNARLPFEGGFVQLRELYIPNNAIIELLRFAGAGNCFAESGCFLPPNMVPADTLLLSWNPDFVLTNVPDARREFGQLQFTVNVVQPRWTANASLVFTNLEGNLDNVTGYDDPSGFGPGPYVRVNEGVNSFGKLPNFSKREYKLSIFGDLGRRTNGGVFWTWATGDHFAPVMTLSGQGFYNYRLHYVPPFRPGLPQPGGNLPIMSGLLKDLEGHRVFIGPRGLQQYQARALVDLRLEHQLPIRGRGDWLLTLEMFNVLNAATPTRFNTSVNRGRNFYYFLEPDSFDTLFRSVDPNEYYRSILGRVPSRTLRVGTSVRF